MFISYTLIMSRVTFTNFQHNRSKPLYIYIFCSKPPSSTSIFSPQRPQYLSYADTQHFERNFNIFLFVMYVRIHYVRTCTLYLNNLVKLFCFRESQDKFVILKYTTTVCSSVRALHNRKI